MTVRSRLITAIFMVAALFATQANAQDLTPAQQQALQALQTALQNNTSADVTADEQAVAAAQAAGLPAGQISGALRGAGRSPTLVLALVPVVRAVPTPPGQRLSPPQAGGNTFGTTNPGLNTNFGQGSSTGAGISTTVQAIINNDPNANLVPIVSPAAPTAPITPIEVIAPISGGHPT